MLHLVRYDGAASELMRLVHRPRWLNGVAAVFNLSGVMLQNRVH